MVYKSAITSLFDRNSHIPSEASIIILSSSVKLKLKISGTEIIPAAYPY